MGEYRGTDILEAMTDAVKYNKFLLSLVFAQARTSEQILDIGAGIGTFAKPLTEAGYRVHCVEPDKRHAARIANGGLPVSTTLEEIEDCSCDYILDCCDLPCEGPHAILGPLRKC